MIDIFWFIWHSESTESVVDINQCIRTHTKHKLIANISYNLINFSKIAIRCQNVRVLSARNTWPGVS